MCMVLQIEMSQDSDDVFTFHSVVPENIKTPPPAEGIIFLPPRSPSV